jgi:transposase
MSGGSRSGRLAEQAYHGCMTLEERNTQLEAENARLREQVTALLARVQELEGRLAKDSHNSSKPPSSDGLKRKTKSLRAKSGKKPGGQLGHRGETLRLVATPDEVVAHRPTHCPQCQTPLAEAEVVLRQRRQVQELPPVVRLVVREHQVLHLRCPHCSHVSMGTFPSEAPSRAQYGPRVRALVVYLVEQQHLPLGRVQQLLADLLGLRLARGTLVGWIQQAARVLEPVELQIKAALAQAPVLHHDETGVRRAGKLAWAHVTSTGRLTHYAVHTKRGHAATDAIGILPAYRGVSVHDGWGSYGVYTACRHALCNVHHLRELTFLEEQYQQGWAATLKALLREMKTATDHARSRGDLHLAPAERQDFVIRYRALLASGLAANPPPLDQERRAGQRGRLAQSPARNLLERLLLQQDQVLAFLDDLAIPFDNNQAERDLRGLKIQQKVSGCFRSEQGADAYATIRGYLATLRKQGQSLLAALNTVFAGQPLYPASA